MTTKLEIKKIMSSAGVSSGSHLLVHSSLSKIGQIEGGPEEVINAFLETVGSKGTLAMPSFCYSWGIPKPYFDISKTPGKTGYLTEIFRQYPGTLRSLNPTHSILASGELAEYFLEGHLYRDSFGIGSPIDKIAEAGGFVLLIGVTHTSNSTIHVGESHADVKKFYAHEGNPPIANVLMPDGSIYHHEVDPSGSCGRAFNSIEYLLRKRGLIRDLKIGNANSLLMKGLDIIRIVKIMVRERADILFCNDVFCRRCNLGRAFVQKNR